MKRQKTILLIVALALIAGSGGLLTNLRPIDIRRLHASLNLVDLARLRKLSIDESNFLHRVKVGGRADYILVPNASSGTAIRQAIVSAFSSP